MMLSHCCLIISSMAIDLRLYRSLQQVRADLPPFLYDHSDRQYSRPAREADPCLT
jgi:hypothetical protein